jgi:uroporphyrinogen-III synthase
VAVPISNPRRPDRLIHRCVSWSSRLRIAHDDAGAARHGLTVRTVVVYRAAAAERLPPAAERAIAAGELDGVLHYSSRSAAAFVLCAGTAGLRERALRLTHFCLSAQVAAPLAEAGAATIRLARQPEETALFELVGEVRFPSPAPRSDY